MGRICSAELTLAQQSSSRQATLGRGDVDTVISLLSNFVDNDLVLDAPGVVPARVRFRRV